jgi:hypothetical protein
VCIICGDRFCAKKECINIQTALNRPEAIKEPKGLLRKWRSAPFCARCGYDYGECVCR